MGPDLRHLLRNLRRSPGSAVAAVLTLSLTLGGGASIFSVVDAVLLTPPPFTDPGSLVVVGEVPFDEPVAAPRAVGYGTFEGWRERAGSLAAIEAFDGTNFTLTGPGEAERVSGTNVTAGFLPLLGVTPALGRSLEPGDIGRPVAVVSDAFWRRKLGRDSNVIGRQIMLGGRAHTIVGVLPERFYFALSTSDIWRPFPVSPGEAVRQGYRVRAVARLSGQGSSADLSRTLAEVRSASAPPARVVATPIATEIAGGATLMLAVLAGAAMLATLVAFTNLAGLLFVRSIDRRRELAVRSALGAGRADIVRQLLIEALALVATAALCGVILALWATPAVGRIALQRFGDLLTREVVVSWRVIGVLSVLAAACAVVCAAPPALMAARRNVVDVLGRGSTPPPRERALRRTSVAGEVALAFVLLASMTLLGRSLLGVLAVNPGFTAAGVMTMSVSIPSTAYSGIERVAAFYSDLQRALQGRLGNTAISVIDEIPLTGDRGRALVRAHQGDDGRDAVVRSAAAGYFGVMRIPIVSGRSFEPVDDRSAPLRVVVSESLAKQLFPREEPIGRRILLGNSLQLAEIIGVSSDVKQRALDERVSPTVYLSFAQSPSNSSVIVVRAQRPDDDVIAIVREEVARLDRNLPVYAVRRMDDVVAASPGVPERRVLTAAFAGFAVLAVVLGAIGLFGVAAHEVASRRAEFALRMALGADPYRILGAICGQAAVMVGSGLAVGGVLSIWASRALGSVFYETNRFDLVSIGVAAITLVVACAFAVLPAALRAARTDPLVALRSE